MGVKSSELISFFRGGNSPIFNVVFLMEELLFLIRVLILFQACSCAFLVGFFIMVAIKYRDLF